MKEKYSKTELFETMSVGKALLTMAVPTIVSQLITMIYNMADTVFIGMSNDPNKVAVAKLQPITYDPMNHHYLVLGEKVGEAFHDGLTLK